MPLYSEIAENSDIKFFECHISFTKHAEFLFIEASCELIGKKAPTETFNLLKALPIIMKKNDEDPITLQSKAMETVWSKEINILDLILLLDVQLNMHGNISRLTPTLKESSLDDTECKIISNRQHAPDRLLKHKWSAHTHAQYSKTQRAEIFTFFCLEKRVKIDMPYEVKEELCSYIVDSIPKSV